MTGRRRSIAATAPLVLGAALLAFTITHTERPAGDLASRFWWLLPIALLPSAGWHLLRTIAWRRCFPREAQPSFARLFRVRLAAEAFSFVTIRGVAGEPLKVLLLERDVAPAVAAASVALERVAYLLITAVIVALAALVAMMTLPLTRPWMNTFGGVAAGALVMVAAAAVLLARRDTSSRAAPSTRKGSPSAFVRFVRQFDAQLREVIHGDHRRLASLLMLEALAYVMMAVEVWAVLWLTPAPVSLIGAVAVETFTRVASMASTFIPANLGALEASNVAAATAVHAAGGAAALALLRRVRGIVWCAGGFLIYPRRGATARTAGTNVVNATKDDEPQREKSRESDRIPRGDRGPSSGRGDRGSARWIADRRAHPASGWAWRLIRACWCGHRISVRRGVRWRAAWPARSTSTSRTMKRRGARRWRSWIHARPSP